MKRLLLIGIVLGGLLVPAVAEAATGRTGDVVNVGGSQIVRDDLYAAGENVTITGTVEGDVVAAGSEVTISGRVTGNVWAAGATVRITGTVEGSVRAAGSEVSVSGRVGRDVIYFASDADIRREARIAGDLVGFAQNSTVAGSVRGDAKIASETLLVSGAVGGNLTAETGDTFRLADTSRISGDVTYSSSEKIIRERGGAVGGSIDFTKQDQEQQGESFLDRLNGQIFWFLASLLLLLGILLYARRAAVRTAGLLTKRPGISLLAGIGFLLVTPLLAGILLISLVGFPLSLFTLFAYALVLYSAKIFVALAIGGAIARKLPDRFWPVFGAGAFGLGIYYLLAAIPVVGGFIMLGTVILGAGAQLLLFKELYDANKKKYGA